MKNISKELIKIARELVSHSDEKGFDEFIDSISLPLKQLKVKLVLNRFARVPFYNMMYKGRRIGYITLNKGNINIEADWKVFPSGELKKDEIRNPLKKEAVVFVREITNVFDGKYR